MRPQAKALGPTGGKVIGGSRVNGHARPSVSVPSPWSAVQFRQLATLAAVAEAGSFQGAAELSSVAAGASGTLTVGSYPSFAATHLPPILEEIWAAAPQSRIDLREAMSSSPLYTSLASGEIDLGVTVVPPPSQQFDWVEL